MTAARAFLLAAVLLCVVFEFYNCFPHRSGSSSPPTTCAKRRFVQYKPSVFETKFLSNTHTWGRYPCRALEQMKAEAHEWVQLASQSMSAPLPGHLNTSVLSSLYYRTCEGPLERVLIEPIGGCLRNPYTCDNLEKYLLEKDSWMVIEWQRPQEGRNLLFDVGASTWHSGEGGASQVWLWEQYKKRGILFDAIYAWEASVHNPASVRALPKQSLTLQIWSQIPPEVRARYHWFNIPAGPTPGSMDNPLEILRQVAKAEDYVVLKVRDLWYPADVSD